MADSGDSYVDNIEGSNDYYNSNCGKEDGNNAW